MTNTNDIVELRRYCLLGNDEYQESGDYLTLCASREFCYSDRFNKAVKKEIKRQVKNYQENTKIIERTSTTTHTYEELVWND